MKVLTFCSDLLPLPGLPTSGGGLRCWQLIRAMQADGHEVVASMPLFTFHGKRWLENVPAEYVPDAWTPANQDELVARHRPDAVLFTSTWIVDHLQKPFDGFRLYDLDGPQLLEMHYKRDLDRAISSQRKIETLTKADFVFCAGQRQRLYFWPFLLMAGHDVDSLSRLPVIPVGKLDPPPSRETPPRTEIIVAGGFYPWQDPRTGLAALGDALADRSGENVRARIIGTSHGVTGEDDRQFQQIRAELRSLTNVEFLDFMPHRQLEEVCLASSLAIELHARNPERELAVTTRTIDAMWCGLPVVYNDYGELSDLIRGYDAGWTVDPEDSEEIRRLLDIILDAPAAIERKRENARRLVRERFTGANVVTPLLEYLRTPVRRRRTEAAAIVSAEGLRRLQSALQEWDRARQSRSFRLANRLSAIWRTLKKPLDRTNGCQ